MKYNKNQEDLYEKKLIRIRDEIEDYLNKASTIEGDDLAIALAAGRYVYDVEITQTSGSVKTRVIEGQITVFPQVTSI